MEVSVFVTNDHKKKATFVLLVVTFVSLLMLAVLVSIEHPFSADQFQSGLRTQQVDLPAS